MHLRPLTEGMGSRAGMRSLERSPSDIEPLKPTAGEFREDCLAARSAVRHVDMSGFVVAEANELGESLEAMGVRLEVGIRDEAEVAAAPWRAVVLNIDEAVLLYELAESTVLGMSVNGDSVSSGCAGIVSDDETVPFWPAFAADVGIGSQAPVMEAGVDPGLDCSRSLLRSGRVWDCAFTFGAVGKNCAKLAPGGRVIVTMRSSYFFPRALTMIPLN